MEIPKFDETFLPILEILKTGKVYKTRELIEEVKLKILLRPFGRTIKTANKIRRFTY